jgi:hypothetical protein
LVTGNVAQSASALAQLAVLDTYNFAQSASALAQSTSGSATTTELAATLAINVSAAKSNELSLIPQVRQTNVTSFIVHYICI